MKCYNRDYWIAWNIGLDFQFSRAYGDNRPENYFEFLRFQKWIDEMELIGLEQTRESKKLKAQRKKIKVIWEKGTYETEVI